MKKLLKIERLPESTVPSDRVSNGVISSDDVDCSRSSFVLGVDDALIVAVRLKSGSDDIIGGTSSIVKSCLCP
jgi:hypothetical protein